ncbi:MAG: CPBP family intramembrane metalloprotease [Roseburia sp.]|nr:CPBP family intramembrane metalloprotease [Roseburia sp.]
MEEEGVFSGRRQQNPTPQQNLDLQDELGAQETFGETERAVAEIGEKDGAKRPAGWAKKIFAGVGVSVLLLAAYLGMQLAAGVVFLVGLCVRIAQERGVDLNDAMIFAMRAVATDSEMMSLLTAVTVIAPAVPAAFFYWLLWGRKRTAADRAFFRERALRARVFLMISVAAFGLYYLAVIITAAISTVSPNTMQEYEDMMDLALGGDTIIILAATVLAAPIGEECLMRGLILRRLQKYFSVPAVIIIQAVLFGVFHMNWVQGIYVLPVGAALGYTAVKCRSVLPSIYMHMFYNLMSSVVALLPPFFQSGICCVLMPLLCAGLVWLLGKRGDVRKRLDAQGQVRD